MDPHVSAPRGPTACTACAASKARCLFASDSTATNGKCIRCNRLNKLCMMQTAATRTRRPKGITRVAQLEEKLESLASQLATSHQGPSVPNPSSSPSIQVSYGDSRSPEQGSAAASSIQYGTLNRTPSIQNDRSPASVQRSYGDSIFPEHSSEGVPSAQYGSSPNSEIPQTPASSAGSEQNVRGIDLRNPESLLAFYRDEIADQFPFVIVPPRTSAFELIQDKPFLFKNIVLLASAQDVKAQTRLAEEIMEYLSFHLLIRAEKSLDLLQGLLLFTAWHHFHIHLGRRLTTLLCLTESLVSGLKLSREPLTGLKRQAKEQEFWAFPDDALGSEIRTVEERRAYLGYYFLASQLPLYLDAMEQPRRTSYVQNCINIIQQSPQYLSDHYLLQLMQLQSISQEICEGIPQDDLQFSPVSNTSALFIKTLQSKLNIFEQHVPIHLKLNPFLLMNYHSLLIYLTATALYIPSLPSRQAILHACLTSVISFFSALFSVPTLQYYKVTYLSWQQATHALSTLSKLSLFKSEDWDLSHVAIMMDLSLTLDGMLSRFEELSVLRRRMSGRDKSGGDAEDADGVLGRLIPRFREMRVAFEKRRAEIMQRGDRGTFAVPQMTFSRPLEPQMQLASAPMMVDPGYDSLMQFNQFEMPLANFSHLDDAFWQEFAGDINMI